MNRSILVVAGAACVPLLALLLIGGCSAGGGGGTGGTGLEGGAGGSGGGGSGGVGTALKLELSASLTELDVGEVTELTWTVSEGASCEASGGWSGDKTIDGATERVRVYRDTTYTVTCRNTEGDEVSASVDVITSGRIMGTVTVSPHPAQGGERMMATITVSNPSDAPVEDVEVELQIPDGVEPLSAADIFPGATCTGSCGPGDVILWALGTLQSGEVRTLLVFPIVVIDIEPGTVLPFVVVIRTADDTPLQKTGSTQQGERPIALRMEGGASQADPGDEVPYAVHYSNESGASLDDVIIAFTLPLGTSLVSASGGGSLNAEGQIEWALGALGVGEAGSFYIIVLVDEALPPGAQLEAQAEATVGDERTMATTYTSLSEGRLQAFTRVDPKRPRAGEQVRVMATASNRSPVTQSNVEIGMLIPDGVDPIAQEFLSVGGTCPGGTCEAREQATWVVGDLAPGASETVSLVAVVGAGTLDGTLLNFDSLVSVGGVLVVQSTATAVSGEAELELRLTESDHPVRPGQMLSYTLDVANRGTGPAAGEVTFRVPSETAFTKASNGGTADANGTVRWPLQGLAAGSGTTRQVDVTVDASARLGSQLRADATASLTGSLLEPRATAYTPVSAAALVASVELSPSPVKTSEAASIAVTVSNPGSQAAQNVTVDVRIPQQVAELTEATLSNGGTCPGGTCTEGEMASWSVGALGAGDATTVTLPAVVAPDASGGSLISFDATIRAINEVPVLSSATAVVDDGRVLDLAVSDSPHPGGPGETVVYVVYFGNTSAATIDGLLTLLIPVGTTVVSISDAGVENSSGEAEWPIMDLAPGGSGTRELAVRIDDTLPEGSQLRTQATFVTGNGESERVIATEHTPVGTSALLVTSSVTPDKAEPNDALTATTTVTNDSGAPVNGVTLSVRIPSGLDPITDGDLPMAGTCPGGTCNAGDLAVWSFGTLTMGASVNVSFPTTISAGTTSGTLLSFESEAGASSTPLSKASATATVCSGGSCTDRSDLLMCSGFCYRYASRTGEFFGQFTDDTVYTPALTFTSSGELWTVGYSRSPQVNPPTSIQTTLRQFGTDGVLNPASPALPGVIEWLFTTAAGSTYGIGPFAPATARSLQRIAPDGSVEPIDTTGCPFVTSASHPGVAPFDPTEPDEERVFVLVNGVAQNSGQFYELDLSDPDDVCKGPVGPEIPSTLAVQKGVEVARDGTMYFLASNAYVPHSFQGIFRLGETSLDVVVPYWVGSAEYIRDFSLGPEDGLLYVLIWATNAVPRHVDRFDPLTGDSLGTLFEPTQEGSSAIFFFPQ